MVYSFFGGRVKKKILTLLFQNPTKTYHMRSIGRITKEHINSVREALLQLVKEGVCTKEALGRKLLFQANKNFIFYDETLRIIAKRNGLGGRIIKEKMKLGKIRLAFLTDTYYKRREQKADEVNLFIIGSVSLPDVDKIVKEEGNEEGREINYSVMTVEEYFFRKKNKDPFLTNILQKNRLILIGKEEVFI